MQIFVLPIYISLFLCFALWSLLPLAFAFICQKLPASFFKCDNWFFKSKKFEDGGKIYERIFKIKSWKGYLPDGAAVTKLGYRKKHIDDYSTSNLEYFLEQSCRAELSHLLSITIFWIFGLFLPPITIPIMLLYAVVVNLPCIMAQRYNRPRILKLLKRR